MTTAGRTSRERRLWLAAAALLLAIYASLYWVRPLAEWLRDHNLLRLAIAVLFVGAATVVLRWRLRSPVGRREIAVLAAFAVLYLLVLWPIRMPEERFHLLEYGLLAGLVYAALLERRRPGEPLRWAPLPAAVAIVATALAGWLDEAIQHLLPNRHYDWTDVALNLLAAVLAIGGLTAMAEARRADRAAGG